MAKEIERQGILVVHCCSIVPISMTVGGNRIIPTTAIPHPFGDPTETKIKDVIKEKETELNKKLSESEKTELEKKLKAEEPERELRVRREYLETTLKAMQTHIDQQTVFSE
jgi:betaine reductase